MLAGNCIHSVNNPTFVKVYNEKRKEFHDTHDKRESEKRQRLKKQIEDMVVLRSKHGHESTHHFSKWNISECGLCLQYKKQPKKDPAMPKDLVS